MAKKATAAAGGKNPEPVLISPGEDDKKYKVKVFLSPDHSIEPVINFISSAKKSIDVYMPGNKGNCFQLTFCAIQNGKLGHILVTFLLFLLCGWQKPTQFFEV